MLVSILRRKLNLNRAQRLLQQIRTGYIVLLPEVNPENSDQNPLYKNGFPNIENITQERCVSTFGQNILDFEHGVREVENDIIEQSDKLEVFEDVVDRLEESGAKLETTWGLLKTLYLVDKKTMPSEIYLRLNDRARKARGLKYNSGIIYQFFKNSDVSKLTEEEQRVISKFLTEGKLNGLHLKTEDEREVVENRRKDIAVETIHFNNRIQIGSRKFSHIITNPAVTEGFPVNLLKSMAISNNPFEGPWKVTLNVMDEFLKYCPDHSLRWNVWVSSRQVASFEQAELNNSQCLEKIRFLRRQLAQELGYDSYPQMSMETKMAGSVENVQKTLGKILNVAKPQQLKEVNSLQKFAEDYGFLGTLELWDVPFWERRQKKYLYHWDDKKMKEFFPYEKVINGLIKLVSNYFNIRIEEVSGMPTWHPDCRVYNIHDSDTIKPRATLYIDPFRRDNKLYTEIGQVISMRPRARVLGPTPAVASLIFNFSPPLSKDEPSLLTLSEVDMLFSKFGEALQKVLCDVNYLEVSGLSNVEWDAVHIVGSFMSLLLTDPDVVREISGHFDTKETIPIPNLAPILTHMSGYHTCNELYLANLDLNLHISKEFWMPLMKEMWPQYFNFPLYKYDEHPLSFKASISQGAACALYSKLWAKILAADAFNTFKTESDKANIGQRFRDTFLTFGGACHAGEVFRRFQGRDPTPEAFISLMFSSSV